MSQIQYTAGEWVPSPRGWRTRTEPGSIEQARRELAKMAGEAEADDWILNPPMLLRRLGPDYPWEPVEDPARDEIRRVLLRLADEFRRIGTGVVQGTDLYSILSTVARGVTAPSQNPEEFDA